MENEKKVTEERTRYSDEELQEFKELIEDKLRVALEDYERTKAAIDGSDSNDIAGTSPTYKALEDGALLLNKEENRVLAQHQAKYIAHLNAALVRIENKSYGICRVTGKLIPKERLRLVPHTTLSIEAKLQQKN